MAVSITRVDRRTGEAIEISISTMPSYKDLWEPLCNELGLVWLPRAVAGGWLTDESRLGLISELQRLRDYIRDRNVPRCDWIADQIDGMLPELEGYSCGEYEFVTG